MKFKECICLFVLIVFSFSMTGENKNDFICIKGLEKIYRPNDSILFYIQNLSDSSISFSISIEEQISNQWVEISHDVFQTDFSKSTLVQILNSKEGKYVFWNTSYLPRISMTNQNTTINPFCGVFRFVVHWRIGDNKREYRYFSEEFQVVEC